MEFIFLHAFFPFSTNCLASLVDFFLFSLILSMPPWREWWLIITIIIMILGFHPQHYEWCRSFNFLIIIRGILVWGPQINLIEWEKSPTKFVLRSSIWKIKVQVPCEWFVGLQCVFRSLKRSHLYLIYRFLQYY